jgi:predicted  nucleic acid-binding Zn-ribbon protein
MNDQIIKGDLGDGILENQKLAAKVTEFWHTIEFLDQPVFPKESWDNKKKLREEEKNIKLKKKTKPYQMFSVFHILEENTEIEELIDIDNNKFIRNPEKGKEVYICVSKLERSELVERLDQFIGIEYEAVEKDRNILAGFALKVDGTGVYILDSFNISPLLWGIDITRQYGMKAQNYITTTRYKNDLQKYEKLLQEEGIITNKILKVIWDEINNDYIKKILNKTIKFEGVFIYNRYSDQKALERLDEKSEDLSDLSKGYFSDDLLMVKEKITNNTYGHNSKMQQSVIDYISSISENKNKNDLNSMPRIDIKNDKNEIGRWLMPEKLPLGKWPSKYNPALMQQVAINIQISQTDDIKSIFSVNGPPGTGKTTLLKEIIAHNIVERADMLAKYDTPDDAFIECKFKDGNFKDAGYDQYFYKYHKFKDEELSNYGMLVTSSNNNAVENITKDLPNGADIINNLQGDSKYDSEEKLEGLSEIEALYSLSKTQVKENYKVKKRISDEKYITEIAELPDIYFSWLSHKLLAKDEFQEKKLTEFGMISAPLGKRANINKYCYYVLNPLIDEFLKSNDKRKERLKEFKKYSALFQSQLEIVKAQKEELIAYSKLEDVYNQEVEKIDAKKKAKVAKIDKLKEEISEYTQREDIIKSSLASNEKELKDLTNQVKKCSKNYDDLRLKLDIEKNSKDEISNTIMKLEDSLKFFDKICILFNKDTERILRIKEKRAEKDQITKSVDQLIEKEKYESNRLKKLNDKCLEYKKNISSINEELKTIQNKIEHDNSACEGIQEQIKCLEKDKTDAYEKLCKQISEVKKKVSIFDSSFWEDFCSKDNERSTKAQLVNPWVSDEFNRSREKLFYLALQVHKGFVLSSTACRDNFINLSMMWQARNNSDDKLAVYSKRDRESAFPELLNTLFLFTPVISTTFASVQAFLSDIKEPEKIGLLIVDEAGQAQPQMAVGALYRIKKAIIVGDPKQVEPVVTDDADHIKRVFSVGEIKPYLSKKISVQEFADSLNTHGTFIKDEENDETGTWVGCPLIVHRRCIDPMFSISNKLSYGDSMKIKTNLPNKEIHKYFLYESSQWFDIKGREKDTKGKNHFVAEQGNLVCKMVIESFRKYCGKPDIFVISPFTSVIDGITDMLKSCVDLEVYGEQLEEWFDSNCGTVHKFQGKEAAEVIFLLGCDVNSIGAVRWVNSNIVNVAVTRAKYRLYVVGEYTVWNKSKHLSKVKEYL